MWKTQLASQQETVFLVRHLVDILTQASLKDRDALFANAQAKAQTSVNTLLPQFAGVDD